MTAKHCSECHQAFSCGAGTGNCWCMSFPPIMSPTLEHDCFCPSCLGSAINNKIDALVEESGMESFQKLAEPYRSQPKLIKSVDFTIEDDLYVFSKWYLIKQGDCCRNGCKNCPY
tara:strand:+ start:196 stop:540 length:345 start_codon:yes stop_codon:yes gene_type:complete